ncbi:hypothetical protein BFRIG_02960 [Peribacillus frigoritolerans]
MQTSQYLAEFIKELNRSVDLIADEEAERLVNGILESKKVFVAGAGRSGLMGKSFAMRMMHMGIVAWFMPKKFLKSSGNCITLAPFYFFQRGTTSKTQIYNVKEIPILKSPISQH